MDIIGQTHRSAPTATLYYSLWSFVRTMCALFFCLIYLRADISGSQKDYNGIPRSIKLSHLMKQGGVACKARGLYRVVFHFTPSLH